MWFGGEQPWQAAGEEVPSHALAPTSWNLQLSETDYGVAWPLPSFPTTPQGRNLPPARRAGGGQEGACQRGRQPQGGGGGRRQPDCGVVSPSAPLLPLTSLGAGRGAAGLPGATPTYPAPSSPHGISSFVSVLSLCVLCCTVLVCRIHVLCPLLCPAPMLPLPWTPDPRPSYGAAKVPRMGPSHCCWTSLRTCR